MIAMVPCFLSPMKFYVKTHISMAKWSKNGVEVRVARLSPTHNINVPATYFCADSALRALSMHCW